MRDAGRGIRHCFHRAVARDARKALPVRRRQRVRVLHGVGVPRIRLERDNEIISALGWRKKCGRRPDPKAALNRKLRAGGHGGEGLGDGAVQLKTVAAAERRAAAGNDAARDGEPRAALGKRGSGEEYQNQKPDSHQHGKFILAVNNRR